MDGRLNQTSGPKPQLSLIDAIAIIVGIVIGAGIFRTPSLVAANTSNDTMFFMAWIIGGILSLIGALCYAELTTAFPNAGGDYHFIKRAYGRWPSFLFAWARMSIIQTGSIALLAYIFGDYLSQLFSLGTYSSAIYATLAVIFLTGINMAGISMGTGVQKVFTFAEIAGALLIIIAGLFLIPADQLPIQQATGKSTNLMGLAMVFVLLTFGGWNEAAYISAELKSGSRRMVSALVISIVIITLIYLLINAAFINALGHQGMSRSTAVGVDLMNLALGPRGVWIISILVAISALTSINATIFTGARSNYALGKDFKGFSRLGQWKDSTNGPLNALLLQGLISLMLIGLGLITRSGIETIIEYTAPVFWLFFLLVGIALFRLRKQEPHIPRPFRVPLYPLLPAVFCLSSAYLLYASLRYTGIGALVGVCVMLVGIVVFMFIQTKERRVIIKKETPVIID